MDRGLQRGPLGELFDLDQGMRRSRFRALEKTWEPWLVWLSGFNSQYSRHMPGLWACARGNRSVVSLHMDVSLPLLVIPFPSV